METILKVREVKKILRVNSDYVRKLLQEGKLKGVRLGTSRTGKTDWRILSTDLQEFISKRYLNDTRKHWDKRCVGVDK